MVSDITYLDPLMKTGLFCFEFEPDEITVEGPGKLLIINLLTENKRLQ